MSEIKEYRGRKYEILFGSDIIRDCVCLELSDRTQEPYQVIAEFIYYDEIGKVVFSCYQEEVPFPLIQWLMEEVAKENWPLTV
jgi:hypothetical protein